MRALVVSTTVFFLSVACFASFIYFSGRDGRVEAADSRFSKRGELLYLGSIPFTGVRVERYHDGQLFKELQYRTGRLDGESREYGFQKKLRAIWSYQGGVKDGVQQIWYAEGPKRRVEHFKNGILDGELTEWHLNGEVFRHIVYQNGFETGRKILFSNSNIYSNYVKRDDRIYGIDRGALCMETRPEGARSPASASR